ncbi:MAG: capsular biosynthesis protein [Ruminococcaceae bacterium]|nr:capsular biosynthesis protein [Oscillospiraceae bacterium]
MMDELTFVMDVDGTICPIKKKDERYEDLVPYPEMVKKMREYKAKGAKIVLFSSRNMNSYNGNIGLINANTAPILLEWLKKWEIPYDEIVFGKPWPGKKGFYVDDRTIRPKEFLQLSVEEQEQLCNEGRLQQGETK